MPCEGLLRDEAQEALARLSQQLMNQPTKITAVFFTMNSGFLFDSIFGITSFAPVLIQFNRI